MIRKYYQFQWPSFKEEEFKCSFCNWKGKANELKPSEYYPASHIMTLTVRPVVNIPALHNFR
jgi:hypothetical protein